MGIDEKKGSQLRIGDWFQMTPIEGKVRKFELKRTEYHLTSSGSYQSAMMGTQILLSSRQGEDFQLRLYITGEDTNSAYCLESENGIPFFLNGSAVYKALLKQGDRIQIGLNLIQAMVISSDEILEEEQHSLDKKVIESHLNILIEGETGTGKSHLARRIHEQSGRRGSFVQLNLSSFGEGVIESELFGHLRGAFTGAFRAKEGALSEANHGTLFLDEIDSLPLWLQTKLLLFLDTNEFRPVGGGCVRKVDIRLICASGQNLEQLVEQGKMRKDFYFRIASGDIVRLKSLREDPDRLKVIVKTLLKNTDYDCSDELIRHYQHMSWPGNIRQLKAHLERKIILSKSYLLSPEMMDYDLEKKREKDISFTEVRKLEELKDDYIFHIFQKVNQNRKLACELLGVSIPTLRAALERLGARGILTFDGVCCA